jgi:hypothetical protein
MMANSEADRRFDTPYRRRLGRVTRASLGSVCLGRVSLVILAAGILLLLYTSVVGAARVELAQVLTAHGDVKSPVDAAVSALARGGLSAATGLQPGSNVGVPGQASHRHMSTGHVRIIRSFIMLRRSSIAAAAVNFL